MGITKNMIIKEKMLGSFIKFSQIFLYQEKDGNQSTEIVHGYWGLKRFKPILNSFSVQCKLTSVHTWQLSAVVLCLHYLEHQEETAARKGANQKKHSLTIFPYFSCHEWNNIIS